MRHALPQRPSQHPFKRFVAICAALAAVVLSASVLLMGGGFVFVLSPFVFLDTPALQIIGLQVLALFLIVIGAVNVLCLPHLMDAKAYANPAAHKAVTIANALLLMIATLMLVFGTVRIVVLLVGGTALVALFAVHLGRIKPIPPGHCQWCGYDVTGLGGCICPECGTDHPRTVLDRPR